MAGRRLARLAAAVAGAVALLAAGAAVPQEVGPEGPEAAVVAPEAGKGAVAPEASGAAVAPEASGAAVAPEAEPARGPVTSLPLPRYVSLRAETANARRGPSLSHRVDWEFVRRGWPLQITAEYGHWRRVRDVEGAGGWVHHSLLSGVRTVVFAGDALVPLHVTTSETSAIRAYVEPGVVARLDRCEAEWCRVMTDSADGWTRRTMLWGAE
jgi:SH3-like domain-containing protein